MGILRFTKSAIIPILSLGLLFLGVFLGLWLAHNYYQKHLIGSVVLESRAKQNAMNLRMFMEDEAQLWNGLINEFNLSVLSLRKQIMSSTGKDKSRGCTLIQSLNNVSDEINIFKEKNTRIVTPGSQVQAILEKSDQCMEWK